MLTAVPSTSSRESWCSNCSNGKMRSSTEPLTNIHQAGSTSSNNLISDIFQVLTIKESSSSIIRCHVDRLLVYLLSQLRSVRNAAHCKLCTCIILKSHVSL